MNRKTTLFTHYPINSFLRNITTTLIVLTLSVSFMYAHAGNTASSKHTYNNTPISDIFISLAGHNLVLSWQVEKTAFNYYEVERSYDGKTYTTIGLVLDAPDNSNTCLFKDKLNDAPKPVTTWYRIKGYEKNGTVLYSPSSTYMEYTPENTSSINTIVFSPNPFNNTGSIKYFSNQAGIAEIKLQSSAGETLLSKQSVLSKGYNNIQLGGLNSLASGIYVARLIINGMVIANQKVVKE